MNFHTAEYYRMCGVGAQRVLCRPVARLDVFDAEREFKFKNVIRFRETNYVLGGQTGPWCQLEEIEIPCANTVRNLL